MKNKHVATYGKKIASSDTQGNCGSYHIIDSFRYKSTIAALLAQGYGY